MVIKIGTTNRVTPMIQMKKAVKQGCPLAPILFAIVMDELHEGYRRAGWGYKLKKGPLISSRGYCDDTMITASNWETLQKMNEWTKQFCDRHHFKMNIKDKSFVT
jgi:hypothetical protein